MTSFPFNQKGYPKSSRTTFDFQTAIDAEPPSAAYPSPKTQNTALVSPLEETRPSCSRRAWAPWVRKRTLKRRWIDQTTGIEHEGSVEEWAIAWWMYVITAALGMALFIFLNVASNALAWELVVSKVKAVFDYVKLLAGHAGWGR